MAPRREVGFSWHPTVSRGLSVARSLALPQIRGLLAPNDPSSMEKAWSLALWSVLVCCIAIITDNSKGDGTGTIPRQKGRSK